MGLLRRTGKVLLVLPLAVVALAAIYLAFAAVSAQRRIPAILDEVARLERAGWRAADLPARWRAILLAVEDPAFDTHSGIDLRTPGAGLTTITQALAKRLCFDEFRPGALAKARQSVCAVVIDRAVTKDQQLTLLLNTASLGPGARGWIEGFPSAAGEYFGKAPAELTDDEFTTLVAMLVAPARYHPVRDPIALGERVRRIRRLLAGECAPRDLGDVLLEACR